MCSNRSHTERHSVFMANKWLIGVMLCGLTGCAIESGGDDVPEGVAQVYQELTQAQRESLINAKRAQNTWLGSALAAHEHYNSGEQGARRRYQEGNIYVGDSVGVAHTLYGLIHAKWAAKGGRSTLGFPTTDELSVPGNNGRFNHFQNGWSVYYKNGASEAYEVHGCHRLVWSRLAWEKGRLGFPTSDEFTLSGMQGGVSRIVSRFEFGNLYFTPGSSGSCEDLSWPVLTGFGPIPPSGSANIGSAALSANQLGARLSASGSNFNANERVQLRITSPVSSYPVATVSANGSGSFSYSQSSGYISHGNIRKIDGYVTVVARGSSSGKIAAARVSVPFDVGYNYSGNY